MKKQNFLNNSFSIIVPVYNGEKFIKKCINSLLLQDYDNYEIIVINDGSTDDSWKILNDNFGNETKIKLFNQKNSGVSKTRNLGIKKATKDWITFVDADDWIEKDALGKINGIINKNENLEMIICNLYCNTKKTEKILYVLNDLVLDGSNKNELIETIVAIDYGQKKYGLKFGNCRCIGGKFYKTSLIKNNNINFPEEIVSYEDGILNLYSSYFARKIYIYSKPLYHYYFNDHSRTNTLNKLQSNQNKLILDNVNSFLSKFKINKESLGYCNFDLFTLLINVIVENHGIRDGVKQLNTEYTFFSKYFYNDIQYNFLINKNKLVYYLLKHKMFTTLYMIYYLKNIVKH